VCDELWENADHLTEVHERVVFLMELNAWISILKEQLIGIKEYLIRTGNLLFVISILYYKTLFHIKK